MDKALSLYIHIPFCHRKCDYCDFYSVGESKSENSIDIRNYGDAYVDSLVKEIAFYAENCFVKKWNTVYVGGGTPSILSEPQIERLFCGIKSAAFLDEDTEVTVEMNPEDVTESLVKACHAIGVNRISMGIQALDDKALGKVCRKCDVPTVLRALDVLDLHWKDRLSVDFIAGLPGQTYSSFESQFELLEKYRKIDHVSLYTLTVEENTPLWRKIEKGEVKFSCDKADRMWALGRKLLEEKGFFQYEVSNFAKKGFESRHNSSYWKSLDYIGCGAGATGTLYGEKSALRWTDTLSIPAYTCFWGGQTDFDFEKIPRKTEKLDEDTIDFEFLMMGFRMLCGVSASEYEKRFDKKLSERLGADDGVFKKWEEKKLASRFFAEDGEHFALNKKGILFLNRFLEEIL